MPKPKHNGKRSLSGRHVQLPEYVQATEAWSTLKPGPRAVYIELKRRFNGGNNGQIWLSHRDAAKAICVSKNTVGPYFATLVEHGLIHETQGACLGPNGIGQATLWALDELPTHEGKPATKGFLMWKKQKPIQKTGTFSPRKLDQNAVEQEYRRSHVPKSDT